MSSTLRASAPTVSAARGASSRQHYILFVDDEQAIINSLRRATRPWAAATQVEVLTANSGTEALDLIRTYGGAVCVMVSDLRMPGMNGSELIQQAKKELPELVCIMLTGYSDVTDVKRSIQAGIYAYVVKPWDNDDLVAEISRAYDHAKVQRDNVEYLRMLENELQWAGELQQKLLDVDLPQVPGARIRVLYQPLPWLSCGGDYYDVIPFGPQACIVLIGDVAGHGMQAAFVTTMLKSMIFRGYIRDRIGRSFSPADFLRWLNLRILEEFATVPEMILTFSATLIDPQQKLLVTANGGHENLLILRNGSVQVVSEHTSVLGVSEDARYRDHAVHLYPEDELLFYTDGFKENTQVGERLSDGQVGKILRRHPFADGDDRALVEELQGHLHRDAYPTDDVTLVRVHIT